MSKEQMCNTGFANFSIFSLLTFLTFVFQFDLVCSDDYLVALSQSMYMFGILCGVVISGILSDK